MKQISLEVLLLFTGFESIFFNQRVWELDYLHLNWKLQEVFAFLFVRVFFQELRFDFEYFHLFEALIDSLHLFVREL